MTTQSFSTTVTLDATAAAAFEAICNPRGWWAAEIEGETDRLGAVFYHHYEDVHHCVFKVTELVPGRKVVWHVLHNDFNFVKDKREWTGTDVTFEISTVGGKTEIRFSHVGLTPAYECYEVCSDAWGQYLKGSLRDLIIKGLGKPDPLRDVLDRAAEMSTTL